MLCVCKIYSSWWLSPDGFHFIQGFFPSAFNIFHFIDFIDVFEHSQSICECSKCVSTMSLVLTVQSKCAFGFVLVASTTSIRTAWIVQRWRPAVRYWVFYGKCWNERTNTLYVAVQAQPTIFSTLNFSSARFAPYACYTCRCPMCVSCSCGSISLCFRYELWALHLWFNGQK